MSKADRAAWQSARTLADLGELTAQWLEGRIASVPGYCGGPDEETVPLVPVLAKLNRAGFVTTGSQPGVIEEGGQGTRLEQRAAVEGFASWPLAVMLRHAARKAGLLTVAYDPAALPRWRYRYGKSVTVTRVNGERFTGFGVQLPRRHIRDAWLGYGICHRDAVDALCGAWQVTVIDPEWGRNDLLWDVLGKAASTPMITAVDEVQELFSRPAGAAPRAVLDSLGAVWSPDLGAYASGQLDASQVRCALCAHAPCDCPPFGTPEYFALPGERHGRDRSQS